MSQEYEKAKLTEIFRQLGAPNPEKWASSQVEEAVPQLARYAFLKEAWDRVIPEGNAEWIDREIRHYESDPDLPFAGIGRALLQLRSLGAVDGDLVDLVRGMQVSMLFSLLYMLNDSGETGDETGVDWTLFQTSPEGEVLDAISFLHESLLETDPTGREMRPRPRPAT